MHIFFICGTLKIVLSSLNYWKRIPFTWGLPTRNISFKGLQTVTHLFFQISYMLVDVDHCQVILYAKILKISQSPCNFSSDTSLIILMCSSTGIRTLNYSVWDSSLWQLYKIQFKTIRIANTCMSRGWFTPSSV